MKKTLLLLAAGFTLAACSDLNCDCDVIVDSYTWNGFSYDLTNTTTTVQDTCLPAGVLDSTATGGGAFANVTRVECP